MVDPNEVEILLMCLKATILTLTFAKSNKIQRFKEK